MVEDVFICLSCNHTFNGCRDEDEDVISITECKKPKRFRAVGCPLCGFFECIEADNCPELIDPADERDPYDGEYS